MKGFLQMTFLPSSRHWLLKVTSNINITWELGRTEESQVQPQPHGSGLYLTKSL